MEPRSPVSRGSDPAPDGRRSPKINHLSSAHASVILEPQAAARHAWCHCANEAQIFPALRRSRRKGRRAWPGPHDSYALEAYTQYSSQCSAVLGHPAVGVAHSLACWSLCDVRSQMQFEVYLSRIDSNENPLVHQGIQELPLGLHHRGQPRVTDRETVGRAPPAGPRLRVGDH